MEQSGHHEIKSCLLITQKRFYSFEKIVKEALVAEGFKVDVANDEYPTGIIGRMMGKLQFPAIFFITRYYINKHYLLHNKYDVAIIIKGRGMSTPLIRDMNKLIPITIGYNWDAFKDNPSPLKWYKEVSKYYTFDYADADTFSLPCLELFSSVPSASAPKNTRYDVSAVGRNYADRLKYIDIVLQTLKPAKPFIHLHENSIFDLISNFLKNPKLYLRYWKYISLNPLSDSDYKEVITSSEFTIDFAHNGQTGITMRCYEAISLRARIITNNPYLLSSEYFIPSNCIIFRPKDKPADLIVKYNTCKNSLFVSKTRLIKQFIADLLA